MKSKLCRRNTSDETENSMNVDKENKEEEDIKKQMIKDFVRMKNV